jgi:pentatricopeptide repeat protein
MVLERAMKTNEVVLGCMLESLVCNGEVSDAVALFREAAEGRRQHGVLLLLQGVAMASCARATLMSPRSTPV